MFLKRLAQHIDARDVIGLTGLSLLALGCWFVWPPAAAIVPGAVMTYYALLRPN